MSVDFNKFLDWAESRFDHVVTRGDEILLNSIFCDDRKNHLWCNPYGGKNKIENGVYHCWKTDEKGSLIKLVMLVDKCSFQDALETLDAYSEGTLEDLEKKVNQIFENNNEEKISQKDEKSHENLTIPDSCYLFEELPSCNYLKKHALDYMKSRKLDYSGLYICTSGRYRNRILIPYYNEKNELIYYNGRYIGDPGNNLRYLGPPKQLGIGKGDVIFVPKWSSKKEKIYITEGEFDAMSINQCGFNSAALGGKSMTETQMKMIANYTPVLCLDADKAGGEALPKMANSLLSKGFSNIFYVRPCKEYKDWNGLLVEKGHKILRHYILNQEKEFTNWDGIKISMNNIIH